MKSSFIGECARYLYDIYGAEISKLNILLPSRRATLFFNLELSKIIGDSPIWQPKFQSLDNLFSLLSGIEKAERLKLIVVLYDVYSKHHSEPFDKFYYWGDMLLSDFDTIDNYMIDAEKLYSNSSDLHEIEERFDFLPEEDIVEINRFWRHFHKNRDSQEKQNFFNIWKSLFAIYTEFKKRLEGENIGYSGMIYRNVAERLISKELTIDSTINYAIIGFNALSSTERVLFDAIKKGCKSDFLWDMDNFYIDNTNNEAGIFIRNNIKRYGESNNKIKRDNYVEKKDITILNSPSSSIESKYVWEFLEQCNSKALSEGKRLGAETAIILTDESLLLPVLYSIPPCIEHFNVTAGYELRLTEAYSLCESLLSLQANIINNNEFYYKDIERLVSHPLIRLSLSSKEMIQLDKIVSGGKVSNRIYYDVAEFTLDKFSTMLFSPVSGWMLISDYLINILDIILSALTISPERDRFGMETQEAIFRSRNTIAMLKDLIISVGIKLNDTIYLSLLRKHLQGERIPFEGEPLIGIQIMGILESRNLDFDNVLFLSVGEANFPSKSIGASFVPSNLRHGYGLPTSNEHQAMYSYYFYRLLQRASRVDISYVSMTDGVRSGEASRYIHQLKFEKPHNVKELNLALDITTSDVDDRKQIKDKLSQDYISALLSGKKQLSATSLDIYIQCPMKFFYIYVESILDREVDREVEMGALEMGNVLHSTLQEIYKPLIGLSHDMLTKRLKDVKQKDIETALHKQLSEVLLIEVEDFDMPTQNSGKFIASYINSIIKYDLSRSDDFTLLAIESNIDDKIDVDDNNIHFKGVIDRVDMTASGVIKIIDYKSGATKSCNSIFSLFDTQEEKHNKPIMQSLLYSMLYSRKNKVRVTPMLYYAKSISKENFSPIIKIKSLGEIHHYEDISSEFEGELKEKLRELLDIDLPFYKCNNSAVCKYCEFIDLCNI